MNILKVLVPPASEVLGLVLLLHMVDYDILLSRSRTGALNPKCRMKARSVWVGVVDLVLCLRKDKLSMLSFCSCSRELLASPKLRLEFHITNR